MSQMNHIKRLLILLVLCVPVSSQEPHISLKIAGGAGTYTQFDRTFQRPLFTCKGGYNKECQLAEGANLDDVVQYFYRQKEYDDEQYATLYKEYLRVIANERAFIKKLEQQLTKGTD